ncbi:MAG: CapA family protein, partial [bacterium]
MRPLVLPGTVLLLGLAILSCSPGFAGAATRGIVIEDFESGSVTLDGYPNQNQEPDDWEVTTTDPFAGTYALRIYGNCWKIQTIAHRTVTAATVWQVAAKVDNRGEMSAFGVGDGINELFYIFAGSELPDTSKWWTVYQGAFPLYDWYGYLLPIGEDWYATHGYYPDLDRLFYVNDDDANQDVATVFDAIVDVTADLPVPPTVSASYTVQSLEKVATDLYRADIQFYGDVFDPDSGSHQFHWDFGDSVFSDLQNPTHSFLVTASYTYTVSFVAMDPDGLVGVDTCQVGIDPGPNQLPVTVNLVGDVMTARNYEAYGGIIDTYGVEYIFAPTRPILGDAADVSVVNLECPYTDQGTPHPTKFYTFRSRPENIAGIVSGGIDIANLANNHALDFGLEGMLQTAAVLDANSILHSGTGLDDTAALRPCYWTERGIRLAFLSQCNFTEREWNHQPFPDAGANKYGFAYLIPKNLEKALTATRDQADVMILSLHSGVEYEPEPPPDDSGQKDGQDGGKAGGPLHPVEVCFNNEPTLDQRALRRLAIDLGADIVVNHHPHVLQGFEAYDGKLIAHSLGNFIMDLSYIETFPTLVLTLEIDTGGISGYRIVPAWIDDFVTQPATGQLGRAILDRIAEYSRPMDVVVAVDPENPDAVAARLYPVTTAPAAQLESYVRTVSLRVEGGYAVSEPLPLDEPGCLARIVKVRGDGLTSHDICWGAEILWHGGFEAEGATLWDNNTSDEWLDESEFLGGKRSLALRRQDYHTAEVGTDLEKHLPCDPSTRHSMVGYLKGDNAAAANILGRFYADRGSGTVLNDTEIGPAFIGTSDWYCQWQNL